MVANLDLVSCDRRLARRVHPYWSGGIWKGGEYCFEHWNHRGHHRLWRIPLLLVTPRLRGRQETQSSSPVLRESRKAI